MNSEHTTLVFVIFKIHPISARIQFLCRQEGNICFPSSPPKTSTLLGSDFIEPAITIFPKSIIEETCKKTGITPEKLKILKGFRRWIDAPPHKIPMYAMQVIEPENFTAIDNYKWIELLDCFSLPPIERQLLRSVYQHLLE